MGSKQAPATVGACPYCEVQGFSCHGTSVYPNALAHTKDKTLRSDMKKEFVAIDGVVNRCASKPAKMTSSKAIRAVNSVLGKRTKSQRDAEIKIQPFKSISPLTTLYNEHYPFIEKLASDQAHGFGNTAKDLIALISNKAKMKFKPRKINTSDAVSTESLHHGTRQRQTRSKLTKCCIGVGSTI
jgi:hypothetical protein